MVAPCKFDVLYTTVGKQNTTEFPSVLRVIDRSDRNPLITATGVTFSASCYRAVIGGFRSDLSITRKSDGNVGNVSVCILLSKVAYQLTKTVVKLVYFSLKLRSAS